MSEDIDLSGIQTVEINGVLYDTKGNVITSPKRSLERKTTPAKEPEPETTEPKEIVTQEIDLGDIKSIEINGVSYDAQGNVTVNSEPKRSLEKVKETTPSPSAPTEPKEIKGQNIQAVELNDVRHDVEDPSKAQEIAELNTRVVTERSERITADSALTQELHSLDTRVVTERSERITADSALAQELQSLNVLLSTIQLRINELNALIPTQASEDNQLADKDFVNSSVATNTAYLVTNNGQPFDSVEELEAYQGQITNNDYAYVRGIDELGNTYFDRYKYNSNTQQWGYEFRLNNSSFTAEQWATINSGLTAESLDAFLPLSGGTMTGRITMPHSQYNDDAPLDMNNSDIKGLNSLIWNDHCEWGEGLMFPRSSGNTIDQLRVSDGNLYLGTTEANEKNIRAVKIADYRTGSLTATSAFQQFPIELRSFASDVTENNVIGFIVLYWTGIHFIASGDWASKAGSTGLKCALTALTTGTGSAWVRCIYVV